MTGNILLIQIVFAVVKTVYFRARSFESEEASLCKKTRVTVMIGTYITFGLRKIIETYSIRIIRVARVTMGNNNYCLSVGLLRCDDRKGHLYYSIRYFAYTNNLRPIARKGLRFLANTVGDHRGERRPNSRH